MWGKARVPVFIVLIFLASAGYLRAETMGAPVATKSESTESLPYRQDSVVAPATITRLVMAVLVALVIAVISILFLKKYLFVFDGKRQGERRIRLIEAKRISPRLFLFLVQVDEQTILIAQNGENVVTMNTAVSAGPERDGGAEGRR
jgi:flagellar biogenesis protein FliO